MTNILDVLLSKTSRSNEHRDDPFGVLGELFDDFIDAVIGEAPISVDDGDGNDGDDIKIVSRWW